jgi:hypothetical protein
VYMLNKHIHALKLLVISMFIGDFTERVYVWRLILKKNRTCNPDIANCPYFPYRISYFALPLVHR